MPTYEVHVVKGPKQGTKLPLAPGKPVSIGRAPANDLCFMEDPAVSSFHARLELQDGSPVLTDLRSKNGTFINGTQLSGSVGLKPTDTIEMGSSGISLKRLDSPEPAAPEVYRSTPDVFKSNPGQFYPGIAPTAQGRIHTPAGPVGVKLAEGGGGAPVFSTIDTNKSMAIDPKMLKSALAKFSKAEKNLATLHAVGHVLASVNEPALFFSRLMDHIFDVVNADRGAIFLKEDGTFRPQVARSGDGAGSGAKGEFAVSQTILGRAIDDGVSLLTSDAAADERFKAGASVILQQIRSAICVPIRGRTEVFGAIYVDSKIARGAFTEDDLELLTTIAVQAGIALENSRLTTEAARAERMAAIGLVVSGLAHDIKNYMMALKGGDFILDAIIKSIPSPEAQQAWDTLKTTHKNISDLVMDMLSYSKQRDPEWANMDVNQTCGEAAQVLKDRATQKGLTIEMALDYAVGPFYFDPKNISRCVMNLVGNAIDASPEGSGKQILLATRVEPGPGDGLVVVEIRDQGSGIPVEARDKVFDLLFSTKGSKGTGLGLALTRKIVEEHGGTIFFETELGVGTAFFIKLPRRKKRPAPGQK